MCIRDRSRLAGSQRVRVEAQIGADVLVPVGARVSSGPDVEGDLLAVFPQDANQLTVGRGERVTVADVDPDTRCSSERQLPARSHPDDVVAREVRCVVEGALRRLTAAAPERRRMAADRAEGARVPQARKQGSETAHRYPADGDA